MCLHLPDFLIYSYFYTPFYLSVDNDPFSFDHVDETVRGPVIDYIDFYIHNVYWIDKRNVLICDLLVSVTCSSDLSICSHG